MLRENEDGTITLTLVGPFSSKKNKRRGTGKHSHYPPNIKAEIQSIELQARCDWGYRKPLKHPVMSYQFVTPVLSKDRDGLWTTVLDCLKNAGVIVDDSIRYFNGTVVQHPAITNEVYEAVVIKISPA